MSQREPTSQQQARALRRVNELLTEREELILQAWLSNEREGVRPLAGQLSREELATQSRGLLQAIAGGAASGEIQHIEGASWVPARCALEALSDRRAQHGLTPADITKYVFALKDVLNEAIQKEFPENPEIVASGVTAIGRMVDQLILYTADSVLADRQDVIVRQQEDLLELSTLVLSIWDGVLLLPLVGTLDSVRVQDVMEKTLNRIAETRARVLIADITGVPTVDTMVANQLLKLASAAKLMGAACILTGISPTTARTIVGLGVELAGLEKRATLEDGLRHAIRYVSDRGGA